MKHYLFSSMLIVDTGSTHYFHGPYSKPWQAACIAETEAVRLFDREPNVKSLELVVLRGRQFDPTYSRLLTREDAEVMKNQKNMVRRDSRHG